MRGLRRCIGAVVAVLLVTVAVGIPARAQDGGPTIAAIVDAADAAGPVAVTAIEPAADSTPEAPFVLVRTTAAVAELPDGSRVSVVSGEPGGIQRRVSLVVEGGAPVGRFEDGGPAGFTETGPAEASITDDGAVRLGLGAVADSGNLWAEIETPDGLVQSPAYPTAPLVGRTDLDGLAAATIATASTLDGSAPSTLVPLDAVPVLEVVNQAVTVGTTQPPPAEVDGVAVRRVRDFLRIAPALTPGSGAPYFVVIDQTDRTITFLDGSGGLPVAVDAPESDWLTDGLDDGEVDTTSVTFDRAGLLQAVGLSADADAVLGVARSVELDDGRIVNAEGPLATQAWFDQAPVAVAPSTTVASTEAPTSVAPTAVPEVSDSDSGPDSTVVIVAVVLAALLGIAALLTARRNRRLAAEADVLDAMAKVVGSTAGQDDDTAPPTRRPGRSSVRPAGESAGGVGVAGARAALEREALEREARERDGEVSTESEADPPAAPPAATEAALLEAMRRRAAAAEAEGAARGAEAPDAPDAPTAEQPGEPDAADGPGGAGAAGTGAAPDADPVDKQTRPDDALAALQQLIDDLPLPGER